MGYYFGRYLDRSEEVRTHGCHHNHRANPYFITGMHELGEGCPRACYLDFSTAVIHSTH